MGNIARIIIFLVASGTLIFFTAHKLYNLPASGVNADSQTYFFDNLLERVKLVMTRDPDSKLQKIVEFSEEKINEMKDLGDRDKSVFLEKVFEQNGNYVAEAIKQIEKIKEKGGDTAEWEKKISEQILEQKEVLTVARGAAPVEAKTIIENGISAAEKLSNTIIEKASESVKEVIVYQVQRINSAIEDKKSGQEVAQQAEEVILLSDTEKIYNIWIENLYAKTLPKADEPFFMRAYIKRRDNECKFFSGKMVVAVGEKTFENIISAMMPNDDLWLELGPVAVKPGTYEVSGKLFDKQNNLISIKNLKILVD